MTDPRTLLISLARKIGERQLTISTGGNVSTKLPDGRMIITPSKQHKSFSDLEIDDLSIIDAKGELIKGPRPSVELPMHLAIHTAAPSMTWVVHAHPPLAVAYACERMVPEESYVEASRLRISLVGKETPGSDALARAVAGEINKGSNVVLMEGHGVVVVSDDPDDAFLLLEELENACKTDLARKVLRSTIDK
jgi:ribulose-5-phosphate 4-epimerase/fuculose-1-phosphate aldolase